MKQIEKAGLMGKGNEIKEGNNIIYIDLNNEDTGLDYIDKKYNEGWVIVSHTAVYELGDDYTLHKKDRAVRKEPGSKPLSKKESSVKTLL